MSRASREVHLAARPAAVPEPGDFAVVSRAVDPPADGAFLVRNDFLAVDPYLLLHMGEHAATAFALGKAVPAFAVGTVEDSRHPGFPVGATVVGPFGWREYALSKGRGVRRIDVTGVARSAALHGLGMPGFTAWIGIRRIARPRSGQTVLVSAAAGAVGSIAGQLAAADGARVIGSAGSAEKLAWLRAAGFHGAIDYHAGDLAAQVRALAPDGIDIYFDNVGAAQLAAALDLLVPHGVVVSCGTIASYNRPTVPGPANLDLVAQKALTIRGFRYLDYEAERDEFERELRGRLAAGEIVAAERVFHGIEAVPEAFRSVFTDSPLGKPVVALAH